jgi:hypothetical protein
MRDIVEQIDHALEDWSVSGDAMRWWPEADINAADPDDDSRYAPAPGAFLRYAPAPGSFLRWDPAGPPTHQPSLGQVEVDLRGYSPGVLDRIQPGSFIQVNGVQWTVTAVVRNDPHMITFDLTGL